MLYKIIAVGDTVSTAGSLKPAGCSMKGLLNCITTANGIHELPRLLPMRYRAPAIRLRAVACVARKGCVRPNQPAGSSLPAWNCCCNGIIHVSSLFTLKSSIYELPGKNSIVHPSFFAKVHNWGSILAAASAAILTTPVALPILLVKITRYMAVAGSYNKSPLSWSGAYLSIICNKAVDWTGHCSALLIDEDARLFSNKFLDDMGISTYIENVSAKLAETVE